MSDKRQTLKIEDTRNDQKYFATVPHIVWVVARDPYDLMFWVVVRMVAGEEGECWLDTRDLAAACSMSIGKVASCRDYLIEQGLLAGELAKEGDRGHASWRLRIPDLWPRNVAWRESVGSGLRARIAARTEYQQNCSPHEQNCSPHEQNCSPHEQNCSPHEQSQRAFHSVKTNKKNQNDNHNDDDARTRDDGSSSSSRPADIEQLDAQYGQYAVDSAMAIAEAAGKTGSIRYALGVLRNWEREGTLPKPRRVNPYDW